jgi:hypothetical protein
MYAGRNNPHFAIKLYVKVAGYEILLKKIRDKGISQDALLFIMVLEKINVSLEDCTYI